MVCLQSFPRIMDAIVELLSAGSMMKTTYFIRIIISLFFAEQALQHRRVFVIERHADKESFAGACDDLRIGVTLIFYLQNAAEYLQQREKGNILPGGQPLTFPGWPGKEKSFFL